jgi:hypothetical protein
VVTIDPGQDGQLILWKVQIPGGSSSQFSRFTIEYADGSSADFDQNGSGVRLLTPLLAAASAPNDLLEIVEDGKRIRRILLKFVNTPNAPAVYTPVGQFLIRAYATPAGSGGPP